MSAIVVENLSKAWGNTHAVSNVSFSAPAGSFTVLLGPSGCGKSTTLRLIAGLETSTGGRIVIGDKDISNQAPAKRALSMVFQSYALFPHLSVAENILFGLRVRRVPRRERAQRLARTADLLGLGELLERRPSELSGGQQQRVALGRAIIAEQPVCLMDEPLSNLDAKLRHEMRIEIRALQRKLGISMVYVTHDQAEAMSMADQVILLRDGRIEQDAPPEMIYQQPATRFAASFIGTPPMNLVALREPADTLLGIRPEDIRITDHGHLRAAVRSIEYLGADSIVECTVGESLLAVRVHGRLRIEPGEQLSLDWSPDSVHIFDATTGRRRHESELNDYVI